MTRLTATEHLLLRQSYSEFMKREVRPDIAVTATLSQARSFDGSRGLNWRSGDPILYEGVFGGLVTRLSKSVFGRRAAEKHGKRIAAGGVIEGDGFNEPFHAHLFLRRPDYLGIDAFAEAIRDVFSQSPWLKTDLDIREIEGPWVEYCHKRIPDRFMYL